MTNDEILNLMFTDFKAWKRYNAQCIDYYEWRESDDRDFFGLKPELRIPVAACFAFLLVLYWPANGDYRALAYRFSPTAYADMGAEIHSTARCPGQITVDGKCKTGPDVQIKTYSI